MANPDQHTPENPDQRPVPDPHRGEPEPAPDSHTRDEAEEVVRPDQQEELGPVGELMHAASVEATAEVTSDPEAEAEAERLGVEGEGVEAAQIFAIMFATALSLALAVVAVFVLIGQYSDEAVIERANVLLYPELREVERVYAEMQNYSRIDSLYRLPIGVAMNQVTEAYAGREAAVPAPDNFSTLYLDAIRETDVEVREYELDALGYDELTQGQGPIPQPGVDLGPGTETEESPVEEGNEEEGNEPEDR
jgi:hypothetical protein